MTPSPRKTDAARTPLLAVLLFLFAILPTSSFGQQQINVNIGKDKAASMVKIALAFPELAPGVASETARAGFFSPLTRDLAFSEIFGIVPLPTNVAPSVDAAKSAGAQAFLKTNILTEGENLVVEVRLFDTTTKTALLAKRYRGSAGALTRIAHMVANDLNRFYTGRAGIFLSQIAFISTRDGNKEVYIMDFDGSNQRRITTHGSISLSPHWSPDAEQLVYTSFVRGTSDMYVVNRRGGGRVRIPTGVGLNIAPSFSPDGREILFIGSVHGNPDIYVVRADGTNVRRLTSENSIESTPSLNANGRQIAFTSSRAGTPQIYVMDAEGTNLRRVSFDGNWNDDAVWAPDGDTIAYTSRVNGRFQIRVMKLSTQESRIIAGEGSNEQPSFSPDGRSIVFASNRSGKWQLYRVPVDGGDPYQLTFQGENNAPNWSNALE